MFYHVPWHMNFWDSCCVIDYHHSRCHAKESISLLQPWYKVQTQIAQKVQYNFSKFISCHGNESSAAAGVSEAFSAQGTPARPCRIQQNIYESMRVFSPRVTCHAYFPKSFTSSHRIRNGGTWDDYGVDDIDQPLVRDTPFVSWDPQDAGFSYCGWFRNPAPVGKWVFPL